MTVELGREWGGSARGTSLAFWRPSSPRAWGRQTTPDARGSVAALGSLFSDRFPICSSSTVFSVRVIVCLCSSYESCYMTRCPHGSQHGHSVFPQESRDNRRVLRAARCSAGYHLPKGNFPFSTTPIKHLSKAIQASCLAARPD